MEQPEAVRATSTPATAGQAAACSVSSRMFNKAEEVERCLLKEYGSPVWPVGPCESPQRRACQPASELPPPGEVAGGCHTSGDKSALGSR